ncbi:hypothetical protein ACH4F6_31350 [Streptomyces sp. NPDC017936]
MTDDTPPEPDDFDDVTGDPDDYPVDDHQLTTRPGTVSGEA